MKNTLLLEIGNEAIKPFFSKKYMNVPFYKIILNVLIVKF